MTKTSFIFIVIIPFNTQDTRYSKKFTFTTIYLYINKISYLQKQIRYKNKGKNYKIKDKDIDILSFTILI